jgi:pentatricopeptide repeat protein
VKPLSADLEKVDEQFYRLADYFAVPEHASQEIDASSGGTTPTLESTANNASVATSEMESSLEATGTHPSTGSGLVDQAEESDISQIAPVSRSLEDVMRSPSGSFESEGLTGTIRANERLEVGIEEMNCIIAACSQAGDLERAFQTYDEAQRCGLRPNVETFNALLSGCVVTRHYKGGLRIIEEMDESDVASNHETVHLLTRLFMRIGYFDKALAAVEDATSKGMELSTSTYQTLARKFMRLGQLGEVRKLIALAERGGITSEAVVARVEMPFIRDLEALDGDVDVLMRQSHPGPRKGGNQKRSFEADGGSRGSERRGGRSDGGSEEWDGAGRSTLVQKEGASLE